MRMRIMRGMETPRDHVLELEQRLKDGNVNIGEVLAEAQIDRSTWTRWKQGRFAPGMDKWLRVTSVAQKRLGPSMQEPEIAE